MELEESVGLGDLAVDAVVEVRRGHAELEEEAVDLGEEEEAARVPREGREGQLAADGLAGGPLGGVDDEEEGVRGEEGGQEAVEEVGVPGGVPEGEGVGPGEGGEEGEEGEGVQGEAQGGVVVDEGWRNG